MRSIITDAVLTATIAIACIAAACTFSGCQAPNQVGRPTVYQIQIAPAASENARPVHAEQAEQGEGEASDNQRLADRLIWRDNDIRIRVDTTGAGGDQSQAPSQETSPATDLNLTK